MAIIEGGKCCVSVASVSVLVVGVYFVTMTNVISLLPAGNCPTKNDLKSVSGIDESSGINFTLAYEQSSGFFDDIPDSQWILMQQRQAKQFPNHREDMMNKQPSPNWYQLNFEPDFTCAHERRMGAIEGLGDGGKWICDPHRINKQENCLVYSVGSNGDPSFEKAIKRGISEDCEIHTFDINSFSNHSGTFQNYSKIVSPYATFHHWGIGSKDDAAKDPIKFKTLEETVSLLGHMGRTVDIFKIDCESCEWSTYREWVSSGVTLKQIQVEVHHTPQPQARDFFYYLHNQGYVIFHKEPNILNSNAGKLIEYAFLKLEKDFFLGKMFPDAE